MGTAGSQGHETAFDSARFERVTAHLARARAKPSWDAEERAPKLTIAHRLRRDLKGDGGRDLEGRIERLDAATNKRFGLLRPADLAWLRRWSEADPASAAAALGSFTAAGADPSSRFEAWAAACARATASGAAAQDPAAAFAIGSLLSFAVDPEAVPLITNGEPAFTLDEPQPRGEEMFLRLESDLGYDAGPAPASLAERYRGHLRFAALLGARLADAGVEVRDMIDVQSLIFIAALERDLWASDAPAVDAEPRPDTYLAVCAAYRNEAPYLEEWIQFHRLVGVERFFLYDNGSDDEHMQVLAPFIESGVVVRREWPGLPMQAELFDDCLARHRGDARWIAFIDIDEFLFSPTLRPLPDLLRDYEQHPAVGVNWAAYGTSGHRTRPPGLVTESYVRRHAKDRGFIGRSVKNIVQPSRTARCITAHRFEYHHGLAVDENGYPIHGGATKSVSLERLRINHYYTKSEEEWRTKLDRRRELERSAPGWHALPEGFQRKLDEFNDEHDDVITAYAARLRAALEPAEQPA